METNHSATLTESIIPNASHGAADDHVRFNSERPKATSDAASEQIHFSPPSSSKYLKRRREESNRLPEESDGDQSEAETISVNEKDGVKMRQSSREVSQRISLATLEGCYDMPLTNAAKKLRVSNTMLKKLCRRYNIQRWPHRQIRSIDNEMKKHLKVKERASLPGEVAIAEHKIELLEKKRIIVTKTASCGLNASLRSAIFMSRPGEIDADQLFSSGVIPAFQAKSSARFETGLYHVPFPSSSTLPSIVHSENNRIATRILPKSTADDCFMPNKSNSISIPPMFSYPPGWIPVPAGQNVFSRYIPQISPQSMSPSAASYQHFPQYYPTADTNSFRLLQQNQALFHQMMLSVHGNSGSVPLSFPFVNPKSKSTNNYGEVADATKDRNCSEIGVIPSVPKGRESKVAPLSSMLETSLHKETIN